MKKLLLSVAVSLLAAPVAALTPDDAMAELRAILADPEKGLEADAFATEALKAAKAAGPLDVGWTVLLVAQAGLGMEGFCRFERGRALLDEAVVLADARQSPWHSGFARAWRAYHLARYGLTAAARQDLARLSDPVGTYLNETYATGLDRHLSFSGRLAESEGVVTCAEVLLEAIDLLEIGDYEQAWSFLVGMYLPPEITADPEALIFNMAVVMGQTEAAANLGRDNTEAMVTPLLTDMSEPGSAPPALRRDLAESTGSVRAQLLTTMIALADNAENSDASQAQRAILLRWVDEMGGAVSDELTAVERMVGAVARADWVAALAAADDVLADPGVDAHRRKSVGIRRTGLAALVDFDAGRHVDLDALARDFRAIFADDTLISGTKLDLAIFLTHVFDWTNNGAYAHYAGLEAWRYLRFVQDSQFQQGEAVTAQARLLRGTADIAIKHGFDIAAQPPDGNVPPGLCQEVLDIEICTILLENP
ncbi:MAG: hypothetical protein AAF618_12310 [Pseudomonadota bacterium]